MGISLDYSWMMAENLGVSGITSEEADALTPRLQAALSEIQKQVTAGKLPFVGLPEDSQSAIEITQYVENLSSGIDDVLVLGIGGSALGPQSLVDVSSSLWPPHTGRRVHFVDNVDPYTLERALRGLEPSTTLVNVISKSGNTVETLALYMVVRKWLEDTLSVNEVRSRLVFTTDRETGFLRGTADVEGIHCFEIPSGVGGRFSVLTPVGLLPGALAGADIQAVIRGAAAMSARCFTSDVWMNPAAVGAGIHYLFDTRHGRSTSVLMLYSDALKSFGAWFVQLWAESLGKHRHGEGLGPTPICATGARDQHSQLQLYMEGPEDKHIWLLEVEEPNVNMTIPTLYSDAPEVGFLSGSSLHDVFRMECAATALGLAESRRPNATYRIQELNLETLGGLYFLFEMQTAIAGELFGIDPYNQPGVEASKRFAAAMLGRTSSESDQMRLKLLEDKKRTFTV